MSPAPVASLPAVAESTPKPAPALRGRTHIAPRALTKLVVLGAAKTIEVPPQAVRATLWDSAGALGVTVTVPVVLPAVAPVLSRAESVRERVRSDLATLGSRTVRVVDVRFSGVRQAQPVRVR